MTELETIEREELQEILAKRKITLVEALSERAYEDAHLPGAINIPPNRVSAWAPKLIPDKDTEVVVYCSTRNCRNSSFVTAKLLALGYSDVRDYAAGKEDWMAAGLPTEQGSEEPIKAGAR